LSPPPCLARVRALEEAGIIARRVTLLDASLRVVVRDTLELQHFIIERLSKARGVANIRSSFALKQVKYKTALPESVLARLPS